MNTEDKKALAHKLLPALQGLIDITEGVAINYLYKAVDEVFIDPANIPDQVEPWVKEVRDYVLLQRQNQYYFAGIKQFAGPKMNTIKSTQGLDMITAERFEQIQKHGHTPSDDSMFNDNRELQSAAIFAITLKPEYWPIDWPREMADHISSKSIPERLAIAGAFCAAEIDRIYFNFENSEGLDNGPGVKFFAMQDGQPVEFKEGEIIQGDSITIVASGDPTGPVVLSRSSGLPVTADVIADEALMDNAIPASGMQRGQLDELIEQYNIHYRNQTGDMAQVETLQRLDTLVKQGAQDLGLFNNLAFGPGGYSLTEPLPIVGHGAAVRPANPDPNNPMREAIEPHHTPGTDAEGNGDDLPW